MFAHAVGFEEASLAGVPTLLPPTAPCSPTTGHCLRRSPRSEPQAASEDLAAGVPRPRGATSPRVPVLVPVVPRAPCSHLGGWLNVGVVGHPGPPPCPRESRGLPGGTGRSTWDGGRTVWPWPGSIHTAGQSPGPASGAPGARSPRPRPRRVRRARSGHHRPQLPPGTQS